MKCFVPNCYNSDGAPFPKDQNLRQLWLEGLNLKYANLKQDSFVCFKHFKDNDFMEVSENDNEDEGEYKNHQLKPDAIPSLSNNINYAQIQEKFNCKSMKNNKKRICRICASDKNLTKNINDEVDITKNCKEFIYEVLNQCLHPLKIPRENSDYLPRFICNICLVNFKNFYKLRKMAFETYNYFIDNQSKDHTSTFKKSKMFKGAKIVKEETLCKEPKIFQNVPENVKVEILNLNRTSAEENHIHQVDTLSISELEVANSKVHVYKEVESEEVLMDPIILQNEFTTDEYGKNSNLSENKQILSDGINKKTILKVGQVIAKIVPKNLDEPPIKIRKLNKNVENIKSNEDIKNENSTKNFKKQNNCKGQKNFTNQKDYIKQKDCKNQKDYKNFRTLSKLKKPTSKQDARHQKVIKEITIQDLHFSENIKLIKPNVSFESSFGTFPCYIRQGLFGTAFVETNDYLFTFGLKKNNIRNLHCILPSCKSLGEQKIVDDDLYEGQVFVKVPHNHEPALEDEKKKQIFFHAMRRRMQNDKSLNIRNVYEEVCLEDPKLKNLVPIRNVINEICRYQFSTGKQPQITSFQQFYDRIETDDFEKLHFTHSGQQFYQDKFTTDDGSFALVFCNAAILEQISDSEIMYVDASFKIDTEEDFKYQLVTVLVWLDDSYYPILFALVNKKTLEIFKKVFEYLRDVLAPKLKPQQIITDYESSLYYALGETYLESHIGGSVFYYTQNIYKKICSLNLSKDLETNSSFRNIYHMLLMLPLLPVNTILDGLNNIEIQARDMGLQELSRPIFDHVRQQWILDVTPELFCVHRLENRINENVIAPFKKLRDFLLLTKGKLQKSQFSISHVVGKLIELESFLSGMYSKPDKKSFGRDLSTSQKKTVLRAWQFIETHPKININSFFSKVLGYIKCMENQLWIWGFYRYAGDTDDNLINASNFSIVSNEEEDQNEDGAREESDKLQDGQNLHEHVRGTVRMQETLRELKAEENLVVENVVREISAKDHLVGENLVAGNFVGNTCTERNFSGENLVEENVMEQNLVEENVIFEENVILQEESEVLQQGGLVVEAVIDENGGVVLQRKDGKTLVANEKMSEHSDSKFEAAFLKYVYQS